MLVAWVLSAGLAVAQVPAPSEVALVNARFALWLQVSAALTDQHGQRPGAAIPFALARVSEGEDALEVETLLLLAETWLVAEADGVLPRDLADAGIDGDLARRVLCYVAGEGPGRAHRLIGEWGAASDGLDCEASVAAEMEAAEEAHRAFPPGTGGSVGVRYGSDRWSLLAADLEVLEAMADGLAADYAWPAGLALEIVPCGMVGARYARATITLCAETIGQYHALADGRIGY